MQPPPAHTTPRPPEDEGPATTGHLVSRKTGSVICRDERRLYGTPATMPGLNISYARVSTDQQDLTAQRGLLSRRVKTAGDASAKCP